MYEYLSINKMISIPPWLYSNKKSPDPFSIHLSQKAEIGLPFQPVSQHIIGSFLCPSFTYIKESIGLSIDLSELIEIVVLYWPNIHTLELNYLLFINFYDYVSTSISINPFFHGKE